MSVTAIKYDVDEVDEIIKLFEKSKGGFVAKLTIKQVFEFNEKIGENHKYKRVNGQLFTKYSRHFWYGTTTNGEYCYGKKRILELNKFKQEQLDEDYIESDLNDILLIVKDNHKSPQKMELLLRKYLNRMSKKYNGINKTNERLLKENKDLKNTVIEIQDAMTNIMFLSQSPYNSLNDMLNVVNDGDKYITFEIENMWDDGTKRLEMLSSLSNNVNNNVVDIKEKVREQRKKDYEARGL